MFITRKTHNEEMEYLRSEIKFLADRYWELRHKHARLMDHLGLYEYEKKGVELREKGGPEPGCSTATDADIIKGLKHNLKVIEIELRQIDEREVSKKAWDHIYLAIDFAEEE